MIAYLEGVVRFVEQDGAVVVAGGVGYKVNFVGVHAEDGESVALFIYQHIREDRNELYGFSSRSYQRLFLELIDISGVGTKLAQKILNAGTEQVVAQRIAGGDIDFLTGISGVGKKTAQKIVLELKGVLVDESPATSQDSDTLEALLSLGYSKQDCQSIMAELPEGTPEARLKYALKLLSR